MRADPDQQAAIDAPRNVVVSAGAGSGKTSVLTRRYVRLVVDEGLRVGEILALTFTRKAAAEMYGRIYAELAARADEPFVAEQLADFDSAFIGTLDSFCGSIARNGCTRYGIPSTFTVDEELVARIAERESLAFIREYASDPTVADAIRLNGLQRLWKDGISRMLSDHCPVGDDLPLNRFLPIQRRFLEEQHGAIDTRLDHLFATVASLDRSAAKCVASVQSLVASVAHNRTVEALARLLKIALRCGRSAHPDVAILKEVVPEIEQAAQLAIAVRSTLDSWDAAQAFVTLLEQARQNVVRAKTGGGVLSYHDVVTLAIRILSDDLELRRHYKTRFRAIMIDEFQDNNELQKDLLYLIAERADSSVPGIPGADSLDPAKLFFVGDEKQSIYRFRGADVGVFRSLSDELGGATASLVLGANYRSEPGLIAFFNRFFPIVFADAREPYEARYEPLRHRDATPGVAPTVELWRVERRERGHGDQLEDPDAQAYHIARAIRDHVENGTLAVAAGAPDGSPAERPAGYSDFAILMRSTGNQIRLERMLRLFGVPYVAQTARSLFLEAPINDMYQLLQLAVFPQDRVAYTAYLRGPLANLSDDAIVRLLLDESALFCEPVGLSADDSRRLAIARERYDTIVSMADRLPITDLLHQIWYRWGYRYHLLRRQEYATYLEYYDLFWELAHQFEDRGLAAFLDEVRAHLGRNEKMDELEALRDDSGVHLMTIHRAKGLEFPIVICAYAENRGRGESLGGSPYYWSSRLGPAFNTGIVLPGAVRERPANAVYLHEQRQNELEAHAELKRLLYVAATRAESHLIFVGAAGTAVGSMLELIGPAFTAVVDDPAMPAESGALAVAVRDLPPIAAGEEYAARRSDREIDMVERARAYAALPRVCRDAAVDTVTATAANAAHAAWAHAARSPADSAVGAACDEAPLDVDPILDRHELAAAFGSFCHALIEHAPADGYAADTAPTALAGARLPDLSRRDLELFVRDGVALANGFVRSEFTARLRGFDQIEHEVPFMLAVDGTMTTVRGQVDLIALDSRSAVVVDFKSDRVVDPAHYAVQLDLYRRAVAALYGLPVEVALYDLRRAAALIVPDAVSDAVVIDAIERAAKG